MSATTPKMTHEEFMKKYNFSGNLRMAQWSNLPQYHPASSIAPTSTVTAEAWKQASKPTYRFIMPSPNLPQLTDDEDSADEQETAAMEASSSASPSSSQAPPAETEAPDEAMAALLAKLGLSDAATDSPPATTAEPAAAAVVTPETNSKSNSKSKAKPTKSKSSLKSKGKSSKAVETATILKVPESIVDVPLSVEEAAPISEIVDVPHPAEEAADPAPETADMVIVPDTAAVDEDVVVVPEPELEPAASEDDVVIAPEPESEPVALEEDVVIVPEPMSEHAAVEDDIAASSESSAAEEEQAAAVDISPTADESSTSPEVESSVTEALAPTGETVVIAIPDAALAETTPATASDPVEELDQETQTSELLQPETGRTSAEPIPAEFLESAPVEEAPESASEPAPADIDFDALLKSIESTGGVDILALLDKPIAEGEAPDNSSTVTSVESDDKHVSFAPGTPEPKPTKRKKKSKDASKPKRRSSISANDAATPEDEAVAEIIAIDIQETAITPIPDNTVVVVVDNKAADAQSPVIEVPMIEVPMIEVPMQVADEKVVAATSPKKSFSRPKSSTKSTGLFAPGGLLSFGGKSKSSKSSKDKEQKKKKSKAVMEEEATEVKDVDPGLIGLGILTNMSPAAIVAEIIVSQTCEPVVDTSEPTAATEHPPPGLAAEVEETVEPSSPAEAEDIVILPVETTTETTVNIEQDEIVQEAIQPSEDANSTPQAEKSTSTDTSTDTEDAAIESTSKAQCAIDEETDHVSKSEDVRCSEPAVAVVEMPQMQQEEMEVSDTGDNEEAEEMPVLDNGDNEDAEEMPAMFPAKVFGTDDEATDTKAIDDELPSPIDSVTAAHEVKTAKVSQDVTAEAVGVDAQEEAAVETPKETEDAAEAATAGLVHDEAVEALQELGDAATEDDSVDAGEGEAGKPASELGADSDVAIAVEPEDFEDAIDAAIALESPNELGDASNDTVNVEPLSELEDTATEAISVDTEEDEAFESLQELEDAAAMPSVPEPSSNLVEQVPVAATSDTVLVTAGEEVEMEAYDVAEPLQNGQHASKVDDDAANDAVHDAEPAVDESVEQTQASEPQAGLPETVDAASIDAEIESGIDTPISPPGDSEPADSIDLNGLDVAIDEVVLMVAQADTISETEPPEVIAVQNPEPEPSIAVAATSATEDAVVRENEKPNANESGPTPLIDNSEPIQLENITSESSFDAIVVVMEPETSKDATSILVYPPEAFEEHVVQEQNTTVPATEQASAGVVVDNEEPKIIPIIAEVVVPEEATTELVEPPASPTFSRTSRRRRSSHTERPSSFRKIAEQSSSKDVRSKDKRDVQRSDDRNRRERRSTKEGSERKRRRDIPRSEDIRSIAEGQPPSEDEEHRRLRHQARRAARKAEEAEEAARRAREDADAIARQDAEARRKRREQKPPERLSTKDSSGKPRPKLGSAIVQGLSSGQSVSRAGLLIRTQSDTRARDTRDSTKRSGRDEEERSERREGEGSKVLSAKDDARRSGADRVSPRQRTERDSTRKRDERKGGPTQSPTEQKDLPKRSDRAEGERSHRSRRTSDRGDRKSPTESKTSGFFGSFFKR